MKFTNADRWLLALKEGDVTFEGIKTAISQVSTSDRFDYDVSKGEHAVFHMILDDLDMLCRNGEALRTFKKENDAEVTEIFRITPEGVARAESLLLISSGHRK